MLFITSLGGIELFVTAFAVTRFFLWRHYYREATFLVLLVGIGILLNLLLKDMFQVPRPDLAPLLDPSVCSFPSGYAMDSFVF